MINNNSDKTSALLLASVIIVFIWSVIDVQDSYLTWLLESVPVIIILPLLVATYRQFRFPNWLYAVIALHMVVLLVGGHYSYAEVPLGYWMESWFGFTRNNYDKIGHFFQGFTPFLVASKLLYWKTPLRSPRWINFLSFSVSMMVSAIYEIIEWLASLSNPEDTEAFLGTQGYIWDTQTDMFLCMTGALSAMIVLAIIKSCKVHTKNRPSDAEM